MFLVCLGFSLRFLFVSYVSPIFSYFTPFISPMFSYAAPILFLFL